MRCFAAIELANDLRVAIERALQEARTLSGLRFQASEKWHITLAFFASVSEQALPALARALATASAATREFSVTLERAGVFPSPSRPRVLWVGIGDAGKGCQSWLSHAGPGLAALGLPLEQRPFRPHVTLCRARSPGESRLIRQCLESLPAPARVRMRVREVTLLESHAGPHGATYQALGRFALQPDGGKLSSET